MTPTAETFTISKELTGYENDQTINPSELNLWRILQINSDGTIDMISEYTSSKEIIFKGEIGYKNYIGVLNDIASAYMNSLYTVSSRCPGYHGQTEFISLENLEADSYVQVNPGYFNTDLKWESIGGGDELWHTDADLIQNVLKTVIAYKVNQNVGCNDLTDRHLYFFAGRRFQYKIEGEISHYNIIRPWIINCAQNNILFDNSALAFSNKNNTTESSSIRPIVTLKPNLTPISGDGSSGSPWTFN